MSSNLAFEFLQIMSEYQAKMAVCYSSSALNVYGDQYALRHGEDAQILEYSKQFRDDTGFNAAQVCAGVQRILDGRRNANRIYLGKNMGGGGTSRYQRLQVIMPDFQID